MEKDELSARIALLNPLRLRLEVPIEGPYKQLMRRPVPEVESLVQGETISIVRATKVGEPVPVYPAMISCYYLRKGQKRSLRPTDFGDAEWAREILARAERDSEFKLEYLLVPVGFVKLPVEKWVSELTARLTPWSEKAVERWRSQVRRSIWLNVVRIYKFDPIDLKSTPPSRFANRISPLRVSGLEPVFGDEEFARKLEALLEVIGKTSGQGASRYSHNSAMAVGENTQPYAGGVAPTYALDDFALDTGFERARLGEWLQRLKRKKQVVFYGPPGTGKTFVAERLARRVISGTRGIWNIVQFHPSYAYEDFIQGIRPRTAGGEVRYEMVPGHFLEFCARARRLGTDTPCVLIIDEINRANLAEVFGELMYLLEYRERKISLSGGGEPFAIPANVYLIGTMNSADRSIALVDQALRRRFAFIRMKPELEILHSHLKKCGFPSSNLIALLEEINREINLDCQLGISFFMNESDDLRRVLPQIWQGEIEPYLEEVLYDQPEKITDYSWDNLVKERLNEWI